MVDIKSLAEQLRKRLQQQSIVFVDASLDEYWTVLDEFGEEPFPMEYDIEYINGQIRASVGVETDNHETIVVNVASLLGNVFYNVPDIRVMGSNKTIYILPCQLAVKPDVLVMKGESQLFFRKGQESGIVNPYMIIEVHSDSTRGEDVGTKLRCYKQLESVEYIIYAEQHIPFVSVYAKQQDNRHWLNEDYDRMDMSVRLGDAAVPMRDIYHKAVVSSAPKTS